jgi:molecular chaperone GrpE (heat shock protein)|tara:strand:- start:137 stop:625 length:489 start_codon:yes stop_codon:yes gene_type:complete
MGVAKIVGKKAVDWIKKNRQSIKKEVYSPEGKKKTQDLTKKLQKGLKRAKYNTGGGADQTSREKLKFHLDKQISKLKKGIDKKRPTLSEYEDLRARTRRDRKRTKHNIGGRANLLEEMGRIDAEKMNPNRRAEKHRVIGELNKGYKSGGAVLKGKKVGCQIK